MYGTDQQYLGAPFSFVALFSYELNVMMCTHDLIYIFCTNLKLDKLMMNMNILIYSILSGIKQRNLETRISFRMSEVCLRPADYEVIEVLEADE